MKTQISLPGIYIIVITIFIIISCSSRNEIDISDVDIEIKTIRYERELLKYSSKNKLQDLYRTYPTFTNVFSHKIIYTGNPLDSSYHESTQQFLKDKLVLQAYDSVRFIFSDFEPYRIALEKAFKRYHKVFPSKVIPDVYTYISGFNESILVTDSILGIGLEKYLGSKSIVYQQLGIQHYKRSRMYPHKVISDAIRSWVETEFPNNFQSTNVLSEMIYAGKLFYLSSKLLPEEHDTCITGFTYKQLNWCKDNEAAMWTYLIENEILYSSSRMTLRRYLGDAPSTVTFSNQSPGKASAWLGWKIIKQYMKKHPETSIDELMQIDNYQSLLNLSGYNP